MSRSRLWIMARVPEAGRVKTRLAAGIGAAAALAWYQAQLTRLVAIAGSDPRWQAGLAVTPDAGAGDPGLWPGSLQLRPQGPGDLGARMARLLAEAQPEVPILIIGSDIPEIDAAAMAEGFDALRSAPLVLGPSADGGYWAIGASRPPPATLFQGVRWSTTDALVDTLASVPGLPVTVLPRVLEDVDDLASLERVTARQAR